MMLAVVMEHWSTIKRHAKEILQLVHAFLMLIPQAFRVGIPSHVKVIPAVEDLLMERPLAPMLLLAAGVSHPPILLGSHVEIHNRAKPTSAAVAPATVSLRARRTLLDVLVFVVGTPRDSIRERTSS